MTNIGRVLRRSCRRCCSVAALSAWLLGTLAASAQYPVTYPTNAQVKKDGAMILLQNYASLPLSSRTTGTYPPPINFAEQLGRVNFLRSEPTNAPLWETRFFVNDLNRNFYILNRSNKTFTVYINFEEVFKRFDNDPGYAGGLVTFAFDPEYASNGIFYTVHTETNNPNLSPVPATNSLPGLNTNGYSTTAVINPPAGTVLRQSVLVEWKDTNINNTTFEGTARELLRVGFNGNIHPMGDLIFNPLAQPGDPDYRNLYVANGDGSSGETAGATHSIPQRLDALQGKILRITPDLNLRPVDELSANGRYRIPTNGPDPNPFASLSLTNVQKEIFAYGFRNPHRLSWDPVSNTLFANDIGLESWEEVNLIHKGTNYGYAEREGLEQLFVGGANNWRTGSRASPPVPFPATDSLTVTGLVSGVTPAYPVVLYSHKDGDAISSGFVYRGSLMPQFFGNYLFGDISTGRIFYAGLADMIASDDGIRTNAARMFELQVIFDSPYDNPTNGPVKRRMFDIVKDEYHQKGGTLGSLPGAAPVTSGSDPDGIPYGGGRADIRFAQSGDGEIYVLSKSDGMIRRMFMLPQGQEVKITNSTATVTFAAPPNTACEVQWSTNLLTWISLMTTNTGTNVSFQTVDNFSDLSAPPNAAFYRLRLVAP